MSYSRWSPNNDKIKYFKTNAHDWNGPKNHYMIQADNDQFWVDRYHLDYKKTIINLKKLGYKKINITCLGKNVTFKAID